MRQLPGTLVDSLDDRRFVDRHVQGLTHLELVQWRVCHVVGQEAEVEPGLLEHAQVRVFLHHLDVGRARVTADLALAGLEFLQAHGGVRGDREHQVVDFHILGFPVRLVGDVADLRVLLIALEHERAGADGFLVDVGRFAFL
ncbi:hypothetical protein D3C84_616360 [compost metagenome]